MVSDGAVAENAWLLFLLNPSLRVRRHMHNNEPHLLMWTVPRSHMTAKWMAGFSFSVAAMHACLLHVKDLESVKELKKKMNGNVLEFLSSAGWDVAALKCVPAWGRSLWLLEVTCLCAPLESIQAADCSVWVPAVVSGTSAVRKQLRSCAWWRHKEATLHLGRPRPKRH